MDPDPVPDLYLTPDPTHIFNDFKDVQKNYFFLIFFLYLPTGTSYSVLKIYFLLQFFVKIIFCQALFQSAQDIYEKREGSGSGAGFGSRSAPLINGSGSGRPKNMRILRIRILTLDILCNYKFF
jgi:hypothetical protein